MSIWREDTGPVSPINGAVPVYQVNGGGSSGGGLATSSTVTTPAQTSVGTSPVTLLAANPSRLGFIIQNCGVTVIKIVFGSGTPTQSNYHFSIPAGGNNNDGSSFIFTGPYGLLWLGQIQAISSLAGGLVNVSELTA